MENLGALLPYIQIALAILLVGGVLLQRSEAGLGSAFGDTDSSTKVTKRGLEKTLFNITIVLGVLFVLSVFIDLIV